MDNQSKSSPCSVCYIDSEIESTECPIYIERYLAGALVFAVQHPEIVDTEHRNSILAAFYVWLKPNLERYIRGKASDMDDQEREDIFQAVFLKAIKKLKRFESRPGKSLVGWFYGIANYTIREHRRKAVSYIRDLFGDEDDEDSGDMAEEFLPDEAENSNQKEIDLRLAFQQVIAISGLSVKEKIVIYMERLGYSDEDISAAIHKSPENVRVIRSRTIKKLKGMASQ